MKKNHQNDRRIITSEMLENLPNPVQRYLAYTEVVGYPWIDTVRLKQAGKLRQGPDRPWMPITAQEFYTTDPPSLVWNARINVASLPLLRAKDRCENGHSHMFGKLASLFTIFDARGDKLDQATMIRYFNEMMWFPTTFLGENISWEAVDDHSARITFNDHGKSVSATMFFDDAERVTNFTTMRYSEVAGEFLLDPWSIPITAYGEFAGLNLPVCGQAIWNLSSGDMPYADLEITEVEYNYSA